MVFIRSLHEVDSNQSSDHITAPLRSVRVGTVFLENWGGKGKGPTSPLVTPRPNPHLNHPSAQETQQNQTLRRNKEECVIG